MRVTEIVGIQLQVIANILGEPNSALDCDYLGKHGYGRMFEEAKRLSLVGL